MADLFNISDDIAPLKGEYFARGNLTMGERMGFADTYGKRMDAEAEATIKMVDALQRQRDRDLQYQMNLELLHKRREDAERERDQDARLGQLGKDLQDVINGEGSDEDKKRALAEARLTNPSAFKNPQAAGLYAAANSILSSNISAAARDDASRTNHLRYINQAADAGDADAVEARALQNDDVIDEQEQKAIDYAKKRGLAAAEAKQREAYGKYFGDQLDSQKKMIDSTLNMLEKIDTPSDGGFSYEDGELVAVDSDPKAEGKRLGPKTRHAMEMRLSKLTNQLSKDVRAKGYTDDELIEQLELAWKQSVKSYDADRQRVFGGGSTSTSPTNQQPSPIRAGHND